MKSFEIEYEIPPLRAIYRCEGDAASEEEMRQYIAKTEPMWRIRKIKEIPYTEKRPAEVTP